eukprot:2771978-Amphidinium_carterae.1
MTTCTHSAESDVPDKSLWVVFAGVLWMVGAQRWILAWASSPTLLHVAPQRRLKWTEETWASLDVQVVRHLRKSVNTSAKLLIFEP